ncbi:MAG: diacylglycerol kinase family lipid kinase [Candidatus Binatia bacterium]|nr:diacylglycerol kinase family lipid kinase [Candidatus Binatia bacterium]
MPNIRLIVNPVAGKGKGAAIAEQVSRVLTGYGLAHEIAYSSSPAGPTELARAAVRDRYALVVAVGGDGLVNQVASELVGSETVLAVIPAGVGNDFARGIGIPLDWARACAVIAQGRVCRLDVGTVNARYFFSVAVMGFAAEVNRRANRFRRWRINALYTVMTVATILRERPTRFTLFYDGCERQCYSWMIAVANTWSCARGMALVPSARPDDGLLDACIVGGMGRVELLWTFPRVFWGRHIYHTGIETLRCRELTVSTQGQGELYADGERIGMLPAVLSVVPRALKVMLPTGNIA